MMGMLFALLIHRNKAFIAIQYGSMSNKKDAMYLNGYFCVNNII